MAVLVSAIDTPFIPSLGDFIAQVTVAPAELQRRTDSGADWASIGYITPGSALVISNPVAGAEYKFIAVDSSTPTVRAAQ